jgi:hypothetical protein
MPAVQVMWDDLSGTFKGSRTGHVDSTDGSSLAHLGDLAFRFRESPSATSTWEDRCAIVILQGRQWRKGSLLLM